MYTETFFGAVLFCIIEYEWRPSDYLYPMGGVSSHPLTARGSYFSKLLMGQSHETFDYGFLHQTSLPGTLFHYLNRVFDYKFDFAEILEFAVGLEVSFTMLCQPRTFFIIINPLMDWV
jgi:hypothetical protein